MTFGAKFELNTVPTMVVQFPPVEFDANTVQPMFMKYETSLEELAKTPAEKEAERKEHLLWSIAENRMLSESARVQALRLLHEIQLYKNGEAEILLRIQELESRLSSSGKKRLKPPRGIRSIA